MIGLILTFGTFGYAPLAAQARPIEPLPEPEASARLEELHYVPISQHPEEALVNIASGCHQYAIELKALDLETTELRAVKLRLYAPQNQGPVPVVIVVPTSDGITQLEHRLSSRLCAAGFMAFLTDVNIADEGLRELPDWDAQNRWLKRGIYKLRTTLDFIVAHPGVDRERIGVFGGSLGGVTASLLKEVDPRVRSLYVAASAGNLPGIFTYSNDSRLAQLRQSRMQALGTTDLRRYEDELRDRIRYDPLYFASHIDRTSIGMAIVKNDDIMPSEFQQETWASFGQPEHSNYFLGHVLSLVELVFTDVDTVTRFFQSHLGASAGESGSILLQEYPTTL